MARHIFLSSAIVALSSLLLGCQSNSANNTMASDTTQSKAVTCSKCRVTWVKLPRRGKGRVVSYTTRKSMECPDCRSIAENFFTRGKLEHTCSTCGPDALEVCKEH